MSNIFYLQNGNAFVINPENESNPVEARQGKKAFLISVNLVDLTTDKTVWTAEAIRKLATGLVPVTCPKADGKGTKRSTKAVLIERLEAYVAAEKAVLATKLDSTIELLAENGYSADNLLTLISNFKGEDLAKAIILSLEGKTYADTTLVRTLLPKIRKVLRAEYTGSDLGEVLKVLSERYEGVSKSVKKAEDEQVLFNVNNRRAVAISPLLNMVKDTVDKVKTGVTVTWKQLSVALALATGRRCAEVHGTATVFSLTDNPNMLSFYGQLKARDSREVEAFDIITLIPSEDVLVLWNALKATGKMYSDPSDVNRKVARGVSVELPKDLSNLFEECGVQKYKDLRDIYASRILQYKPVTVTDNAFVAKFMGHGKDDLKTCNTYQKIYIKD
jgi:hypothetical protein